MLTISDREGEPRLKITWYGHAAFLVETSGLRIIIDPYRSPDSGGYLPISEPADLVVVSHENDRYHSHLGQIIPPFETIRALEIPEEGTVFREIKFEAIHVFETPERLPEDEVTIVHFHAEDLHLAFLGDLGHPLTEPEFASLRGAEIVLAAAGGKPTIDVNDLRVLLQDIDPRIVIPMHYKTPKINLNIAPLEDFLAAMRADPVIRHGSSSIEVTRESLPESRTIVVLDHAR
jgi:L-ascorbate metabolism protein UlaG (beta-lactamase superfamily)